MPFRLSLDTEPIVLIEVSGELTEQELLSMTQEVTRTMRAQLDNKVRAAVVLDFSHAGPIAPSQRRMIGEWRAEVKDLTSQVAVGMAMVVKSPVVRGVLTAISWFTPEPIPVRYFDSFEAGVAWALESCEAAGITVPPQLKRRLSRTSGSQLRIASHGDSTSLPPANPMIGNSEDADHVRTTR